jgi:transcriptional regulator GlxA family with amidase domain
MKKPCSRFDSAGEDAKDATGYGREDQESSAPRAIHGVLRGHVVSAVKVLRERIAEPWTLQALAEEVHLSRSQLVRAFDATVGMSPMAYLRQMRVERMARLLASTDLSVATAARSVGWRNQFHASQCFHAHYGISPTEYRRQQAPSPLE